MKQCDKVGTPIEQFWH